MTDATQKELKRSDIIDALEMTLKQMRDYGANVEKAHTTLGQEIEYLGEQVEELDTLLTELKDTI